MFGAFRASSPLSGGLLWKVPWRMSAMRKARARERLRFVDENIEAVLRSGQECRTVTLAAALPKEHEMLPKDKYTVFDPKSRNYRKGIHKVPKWTRITQRTNPTGF